MNTLDKIDIYLKDKKDSELYLVFLMLFSIISLIVYLYVFPITDKNLKSIKTSALDIEGKVNQEISYINSISVNGDKEFYTKKLSQEILNEKSKLKDITYENDYVDNKLKQLSYLLFNDQNWANFLDSIALTANKNKIIIQSIENKFTELDIQKVEKVLNVTIDFSGSYRNIMNFINSLEESQLVVDIYQMELKSSETIEGKLNIAVWGMKY